MLDVQCCCSLKTQTLMVQVAKRGASVLKRRKSRNRMETSPSLLASNNASTSNNDGPPRSESDGDVVFYTEEPRSGKRILLYITYLDMKNVLLIFWDYERKLVKRNIFVMYIGCVDVSNVDGDYY